MKKFNELYNDLLEGRRKEDKTDEDFRDKQKITDRAKRKRGKVSRGRYMDGSEREWDEEKVNEAKKIPTTKEIDNAVVNLYVEKDRT